MLTLQFLSEGLAEEVSFFRAIGRQERVFEREVSWEITKLWVDGGCAIDVNEALVAAGAERAGVCSWHEELFFKYTA